MLNLEKIDKVYLAYGYTDLRKSIDGLVSEVVSSLKLDPKEKSLFVFCNKSRNRIKILHFDEGFWIYYYRSENTIKWPNSIEDAVCINKEELRWLLKGFELRIEKKKKEYKNYY